eukprot:10341343-Ditylum_brightwellii.AAC.1
MSCWDKCHTFYVKHDVFTIYKEKESNKETTFAKLTRSSALNKHRLLALQAAELGELQNQTLSLPSVIDATLKTNINDDVHLSMTITL